MELAQKSNFVCCRWLNWRTATQAHWIPDDSIMSWKCLTRICRRWYPIRVQSCFAKIIFFLCSHSSLWGQACLLCAISCCKDVMWCLWCYTVSVHKFPKSPEDSALKPLKGLKLLKTWGTLALRLNSFYIMRWLWDYAYKRLPSNWCFSAKLAPVGFWWLILIVYLVRPQIF